MAAEVSGLELIRLWPCVFFEQDLPDREAPTQSLIALAETRPQEGVFAIDAPGVAWLKGHVAQAVGAYLRETRYGGAPEWSARARFEIFGHDEFRPLANQPGADIAGMYVLHWPSGEDAIGERDDALPGCLSFYDPRIAMNMNAIKRDPYHDYHRHLMPRAGLLSMWPAYVSYFVHPNPSTQPAMRVAFEVQLDTQARSA